MELITIYFYFINVLFKLQLLARTKCSYLSTLLVVHKLQNKAFIQVSKAISYEFHFGQTNCSSSRCIQI